MARGGNRRFGGAERLAPHHRGPFVGGDGGAGAGRVEGGAAPAYARDHRGGGHGGRGGQGPPYPQRDGRAPIARRLRDRLLVTSVSHEAAPAPDQDRPLARRRSGQ